MRHVQQEVRTVDHCKASCCCRFENVQSWYCMYDKICDILDIIAHSIL